MKILTKEEEEAHYSATLKGGITGGLIGLAVGASGVYAAHRRFQFIRNLTLPMKAFLTTSSSTFAAIIAADRASRRFEHEVRADEYAFYDAKVEARQAAKDAQSGWERFMTWGKENRYPIVFGSWVASMGAALGIVSRSHHLTGPQKLVQARVYAQGLTLAVLIATAAFETSDASKGEGRWETIKVLDPNDPEHKHLIEKKVHHEQYPGEDLWRGKADQPLFDSGRMLTALLRHG